MERKFPERISGAVSDRMPEHAPQDDRAKFYAERMWRLWHIPGI